MTKEQDKLPLVSTGPSGLGGEYQSEIPGDDSEPPSPLDIQEAQATMALFEAAWAVKAAIESGDTGPVIKGLGEEAIRKLHYASLAAIPAGPITRGNECPLSECAIDLVDTVGGPAAKRAIQSEASSDEGISR